MLQFSLKVINLLLQTEGTRFSSGSHSYKKCELDCECYCYCGLLSSRRTSGTRLNLRTRFHGCDRNKEDLKCKYFKWVDRKFSDQATKVILELLEGQNQLPPMLMDELEDVDPMQVQMKGLTSLVDHLKMEVSRLKFERNFYRALIVFLFSYVK